MHWHMEAGVYSVHVTTHTSHTQYVAVCCSALQCVVQGGVES